MSRQTVNDTFILQIPDHYEPMSAEDLRELSRNGGDPYQWGIRDRENHVFDKGYFIKTRTVAMPEEAREKARAAGRYSRKGQLLAYLPKGITVMAAVFAFFFVSNVFSAFNVMLPANRLRLAATAICAAAVFIAVRGYDMLRYVQEKRLFIYNSLPLIAAAAAAAIAWLNPVDDIVYYIGCVICGACSAVTSAGVIKYFNLLTTRPVPNFFFREGGKDDAED